MTSTQKNTADNSGLQADVLGVLTVIDDFSSLLTQETDALKKNDFKTVDSLQQGKRDIARRYHDVIVKLGDRQIELAGLDVTLRERLVRARTQFTLILQENMRTLEAMKKSTQRLVNRILDAARTSVTEDTHHKYSAGGKMQSTKSASLSLSLDQSL